MGVSRLGMARASLQEELCRAVGGKSASLSSCQGIALWKPEKPELFRF